MKLYTAPSKPDFIDRKIPSIFLAGSIEMGKAGEWQNQVIEAISDYDVAVFNPRRIEWDNTWEQSPSNDNFAKQVNWEMSYIEHVSIPFFFFQPETVSPISLLELGLVAGLNSAHQQVIVVCEKAFWRSGNVRMVCKRYPRHFKLFETLDEGIGALINMVQSVHDK